MDIVNEYLEQQVTDIVNEYFKDVTPGPHSLLGSMGLPRVRSPITCRDGFRISVQASSGAYCTPRSHYGPYTAVELGYPSAEEPDIMEWAENKDAPTDTVYAYVPIGVVIAVIEKHGGITLPK